MVKICLKNLFKRAKVKRKWYNLLSYKSYWHEDRRDDWQGRDDDVRLIDTPLVYQNLRGRLRDVLNVVLVCEARARNHFSRTVFQFGTNERFLVTSEHVFRSRSGRSPGSPLEIDVLERRRR